MAREYGNRRSGEDLLNVQIEQNATSYSLEDQPDFKGTQKELEWMQALERFYIDGYPKVSDEEWDILKHRFNYHESLVAGAPSGREWVRMQALLPSIEKAATIQDVRDFCARFPGKKFKVEVKLDGLTANLRYVRIKEKEWGNGYRLDCITSRGNGRYGLKLHPHALDGVEVIGAPDYIPAEAFCHTLGKNSNELPEIIEIRGEAVLNKVGPENYLKVQAVKDSMIADGVDISGIREENLPVWRSVVSGIFNRKVPMNLRGLLQWAKAEGVTGIQLDRLVASLVSDERILRSTVVQWSELSNQISIFQAGEESTRTYIAPIEKLHIVAYSITADGVNLDLDLSQIWGLETINQVPLINGETSPIFKVTDDVDEIIQSVRDFYGIGKDGKRDPRMPRLRNEHKYACDGVVIKLLDSTEETQDLNARNAYSNQSKIVVPKYPADQIACKLESERVKVKLDRIERSTTSLGNVTLQGILDHPYLTESGAVVSNINLHNPNWLGLNSWIHEGGEYEMVMSMDIIPVLLPPTTIA